MREGRVPHVPAIRGHNTLIRLHKIYRIMTLFYSDAFALGCVATDAGCHHVESCDLMALLSIAASKLLQSLQCRHLCAVLLLLRDPRHLLCCQGVHTDHIKGEGAGIDKLLPEPSNAIKTSIVRTMRRLPLMAAQELPEA